MDYLVYAHLQLGQDNEARAVIDRYEGGRGFTGPFSLPGFPMRSLRRRRDTPWNAGTGSRGASSRCGTNPSSSRAGFETHFARALWSPAIGQFPDFAKGRHCEACGAARPLREKKDAYWSERSHPVAGCNGVGAPCAGKHDEALGKH